MHTDLGLYYLGATINNPEVLLRVQQYSDRTCGLVGADCTIEKERHITIIPPFYADYETASKINLGCGMATLLREHPLVTTRFSIRGMRVMSFDGVDVIHFPIKAYPRLNLENTPTFTGYVQTIRQKLHTFGLEFKETIPEEYEPHITVLVRKNLGGEARLKALLEESRLNRSLFFNSGYPTLYAKYKEGGWRALSHDPSSMAYG